MFCFSSVRGIIFDLDDTLVHSALDFKAIKRAIKCPAHADILEFIGGLPKGEQETATKIVLDHEIDDARNSTWVSGAQQFVANALQRNRPLAIVTRNCREAAQTKVIANSVPIEHIVTREDAPPKPDPTALLEIAQQWSIPTEEIAYIGDYIYDTQAAHNADMQAWLYDVRHANERNLPAERYENCLKLIDKPK